MIMTGIQVDLVDIGDQNTDSINRVSTNLGNLEMEIISEVKNRD